MALRPWPKTVVERFTCPVAQGEESIMEAFDYKTALQAAEVVLLIISIATHFRRT